MIRLKGQVTVYAAISLGLVLSLICTSIKSARLVIADEEIHMASRLAAEAVFAGYNNELLDEFDIFAASESQCTDSKLSRYATANVNNAAARNIIAYEKSWISGRKYMTDNGGVGLEQQVTEYMKKGGYVDIIKDFMDAEKQLKKADKIEEITDQIEQIDSEVSELSRIDIDIIRIIRQINADDIPSLIADVDDELDLYYECLAAEDYEGMTDCENAYERNIQALIGEFEDIIEKSEKICELIDEYDEKYDSSEEKIKECRQTVESGRDVLEEITDTVRNDVDDISVQKSVYRQKAVNKARIRPILENNISLCRQAISILDGATSILGGGSGISRVGSIAARLNIDGLSSECADIDIDKKGEGADAYKKIKKMISKGMAGIVLNGMDIKEGSFSHSGLATTVKSKRVLDKGMSDTVLEKALFNAYVIEKFPSYTDVSEDADNYEDWCELSYVLEYILAGNSDDVSNLNEVILKLSALREPLNFAHIVMDSAKRNQALAAATALVDVTGNMAVIKTAQYVIMGVWSYGESVMDVRRLMQGENLSLIKNSTEWKLSLENLLKMDFSTGTDKKKSVSGKKEIGKFGYEDYLGTLLMMLDQTTKNYRAMQAMELRLIALGDTEFRMKNHVYEAECNVQALVQGVNRNVKRTVTYSYAG